MYKALIQRLGKAAVIELPTDPYSLKYELANIGIRTDPKDIPIIDDEDADISVKLFAKTDIGNSLVILFKPTNNLEEANLCAHAIENAHPAILADMERSILHRQYYSPQAVIADAQAMTNDLIAVTVNYYCPLQIHMNDDEGCEWIDVDNGYAVGNEDAIRALVMAEQARDLNNMAHYFHGSESTKAKLVSAVWDVEEVGGTLYGVIRTGLRSAFTPAEEQEWIDELTGQAADGFGEGLEQREIHTADGDIYVSFWNSDDDYFMENETDFGMRITGGQGFGNQQMGVM